MCTKLGRLSQIWKSYAGTNTMEFIFYQEIPRDRKATHVQAVCDIQILKIESHQTRLNTKGNIEDYPGEVSTPTSDLPTVKIHVNCVISDIIFQDMCMYVNYFDLNNFMDQS